MNETCAKNKLPFFQHAFQSVGQPRETERDRHALGGAGVSSCFKALLVGELAAAAIGAGRQQGHGMLPSEAALCWWWHGRAPHLVPAFRVRAALVCLSAAAGRAMCDE
jgi:hypothetical protein